MRYEEKMANWEKFGTSPVPNAYWELVSSNQPERSKREDSYRSEWGCSRPVRFGDKLLEPGKRYDDQFTEIRDAVL